MGYNNESAKRVLAIPPWCVVPRQVDTAHGPLQRRATQCAREQYQHGNVHRPRSGYSQHAAAYCLKNLATLAKVSPPTTLASSFSSSSSSFLSAAAASAARSLETLALSAFTRSASLLTSPC